MPLSVLGGQIWGLEDRNTEAQAGRDMLGIEVVPADKEVRLKRNGS